MPNSQSSLNSSHTVPLEAPRFESGGPMLMAGLRGHFTTSTWDGIPKQWSRFMALGEIPGQVGKVHYGLCFDKPDGIDYLSGIEVSGAANLPGELVTVQIPAQKYAVFPHREHVSKIYTTVDAIWRTWFPGSGHEPVRPAAGAPSFFERYGEQFDPATGMGDIEVWIPIKS